MFFSKNNILSRYSEKDSILMKMIIKDWYVNVNGTLIDEFFFILLRFKGIT